jgi:tryptophan synthase alpha chain
MTNRLTATFARTKKEGHASLITFVMGGDPNPKASAQLLAALPAAGADIIEIGIPFSDPMADGPVIQAAGLRALAGGTKLSHILQLVTDFRKTNTTTPLVLMGYYNPIFHYGIKRFCDDAHKAGVDGLIIVDLPPEEEAEFKPSAQSDGLALIRLVAPTSLDTRLPLLLHSSQGFVYYISIAGITGAASANVAALESSVALLRKHTALPVAVGFGVKTPAQARDIGKIADGVVVGSAIVDVLERDGSEAALTLVRELAAALKP